MCSYIDRGVQSSWMTVGGSRARCPALPCPRIQGYLTYKQTHPPRTLP